MWIAAFRQSHPLQTPQVIHQALVLDIAMWISSWRDASIQKAGLRQGGVSMEMREHRVGSRLRRALSGAVGSHGLHQAADSPAIIFYTVATAPRGATLN